MSLIRNTPNQKKITDENDAMTMCPCPVALVLDLLASKSLRPTPYKQQVH